jgi:outer membrane protein OmpA-like peptidoglycan-associated protein
MRTLYIAVVCSLLFGSAWAAEIEPVVAEVQHLEPQADGLGFYQTESGQILDPYRWSVGAWVNYAYRPLTIWSVDEERGERYMTALVEHQAAVDIQAAMGFPWVDVALSLPLNIHLAGDGARVGPDEIPSIQGFALGDLRLVPKVRILDPRERTVGFAVAMPLSFPTGDRSRYATDGTVGIKPLAIVGFERGLWRGYANLGAYFRPTRERREILGTELGHEFVWSLGVAARPRPDFELMMDFWGNHGGVRTGVPVEGAFGLKFSPIPEVDLSIGVAASLARGFGAPAYRVFSGLKAGTRNPEDTDKDGLVDPEDACPEQPEDLDQFEDADGCPDLDNDADGILDVNDGAPMDPEDPDGWEDSDGVPDPDNDNDNVPDVVDACPLLGEDLDGFQDRDGCPDPDNDLDGFPDLSDGCPNLPETLDGIRDDDGCPEVDSDGDGFLDSDEGCPQRAEDFDGFEDDDGCPDPDDDKDGILDADDRCRRVPEDLDGVADEDGCPEEDADGDCIVDIEDVCPLVPEILNGIDDLDGCPDEGGLAILILNAQCQLERIVMLEKVFFDTARSTIKPESHRVLDAVAAILSVYPVIQLLEIQGHTDSDGSAASNRTLSDNRAKAVRKYLIGKGIDGSRLQAKGYGESRPIEDNGTLEGKAANRRVEILILRVAGGPEVRQRDNRPGQ